nr:hypothetical protein BaRGS_031427 [Batillaria attramentaria]
MTADVNATGRRSFMTDTVDFLGTGKMQEDFQLTGTQHDFKDMLKMIPINIRHTDHSLWTREQHPVAQPINVQETDSRDDFAQQHVLYCLQTLGEQRQEAMFVMSSLDFTHYLNKLDATHAAQFPLPGDLPSTQREGDFDVIVIHREYGVLLGEIKSVGIHDNNPTDKAVADKVTKAVKQLDKCEKVVNRVMSDVAPGVSVRKTLILPYISRTQLQHVLDGDSQLAQRVCGCVGAPDVRAAVALCVCSDVMSDRTTPWHVDAAVLGKLDSCLAASRLIQQQLVMTLQADPTTQQAAADVHFLHYDLVGRPGDVEAARQRVQSLECRSGHTETGANINPTSVGTTTSPPGLQYRDVLVVTRSVELREETRDVRERRIVVWLPGRTPADDANGVTDDLVEAGDRLQLMSRCSTQLVIVDVPL